MHIGILCVIHLRLLSYAQLFSMGIRKRINYAIKSENDLGNLQNKSEPKIGSKLSSPPSHVRGREKRKEASDSIGDAFDPTCILPLSISLWTQFSRQL